MIDMFLLLLTSFFILEVHAACPTGWLSNNATCYLVSTAKETFGGAEAICEAFDAHLVSIESDTEDKFLVQAVKNSGDPSRAFWTGANDLEVEAVYKWIHSGQVVSYSKWAPGQPDDDSEEDCVTLWLDDNGGGDWHDLVCSENFHFICEKGEETDTTGTIIIG